MKRIKLFLKLTRFKHYIKNFLIFFPLIFTKQLFSIQTLYVLYGFISFSLMASVVYIVNDIKDIKKDKEHPTKKYRPIASGEISKSSALIIAIVLYLLSLLICYFTKGGMMAYVLLLSYLVLNLLYTFKCKDIPILDVMFLVIFYMIRVYYGAEIIGVEVSNYLYLTIMCASLYFSLGKRRNEIDKKKDTRNVLKYYTKEYLDRFMDVSVTLALVFYSLWALDLGHKYIIASILLVFIIFMRYNLTIERSKDGDPVEVLFKDKILIILAFIFTLSIVYFIGW